MCSMEGCDGKPVAKGLCARHYMRLRRNGDPTRTRKTGRKPKADPQKDLFPEWSARTLARFKWAMRLLLGAGGEERWARAVKAATRPNRSMNVSELERQAVFAVLAAERSAGTR